MSGVGGGGGGGDGGSSRVSIPNNLRKTIEHIKEITACHSEEEIYAMLKECSMDPNETAQKLLFQDTFHEVKRRRDRKKEQNEGSILWVANPVQGMTSLATTSFYNIPTAGSAAKVYQQPHFPVTWPSNY